MKLTLTISFLLATFVGSNALFGPIINILFPNSFNSADIGFQLYTRGNQSPGSPLVLGSAVPSEFNPSLPTRFIIHGWMRDGTSPYNSVLLSAFFNRTDNFNIIVVDWGKYAKNINYVDAALHVDDVGGVVARMLENLYNLKGVDPKDVTLIGHSLGAHVAGYAGRGLTGNLKLGNIVALDPANPLFGTTPLTIMPLLKTDANYVQSIQTNRLMLGEEKPMGHASFYPNYGPWQPGCIADVTGLCAHMRSFYFYAESLTTSKPFVGRKCESYANIVMLKCKSSGDSLDMGGEPLKVGEGIYWMATNSASPYSQGPAGIED